MASHKIFSNSDNNTTITPICSELRNNKTEMGKHYCCSTSNRSCVPYTTDSECTGSDFEISQCFDTSSYGPCKRTDYNAARACGGLQTYVLCISSPTKTRVDGNFY